MARRAGLRVAIGTLVVLSLAAGAVFAAASGHGALEIQFACARNHTGLMRYISNASGCKADEAVIPLAQDAQRGIEVHACVSTEFGLAKTRQLNGHPVVIPLGTVWRVGNPHECLTLNRPRRPITLDGSSLTYFCAIKAGGLLRLVHGPANCSTRETALFVAKQKKIKPPIANPQSVKTNEGAPVAITLTGSSKPPGKPLTYKIVSPPARGVLSGSPPAVKYTPNQGYFGTDNFTFTVSQGKHTSKPATVSITISQVDQAPTNSVPGAQSTDEGSNLAFSSSGKNAITLSDVDSGGGVEQVKLSVAHGTLKLGSTSGLQSSAGNETASVTAKGPIAALNSSLEGLTYTPGVRFHGSESLSVETNDLGHTGLGGPKTATSAVSITVVQVDEAPVNTVPIAQSTEEDTNLLFSSLHTNAVSVSDADSEGGVEQVKLSVAHGTLKLGSTSGLQSSSGNETASVTAKGTIAALNTALEGLTYAPAHNYLGSDTLTLETNDLGNTGLGGPKTATSTVAITITPIVYDHAVNDSYSTNQNETFTKTAGTGVLANDTDSASPPLALKAELVSGPTNGTLTLKSDGSFEYVPTHNFAGADTFTYKDNDGNTPSNTATVTITTNKVAFDHAVNDSYSTHENTTLNVTGPGVLANDTDSDSPPVHALEVQEAVTQPAHGALTLNHDGSFTYTPTHGYHGPDSFTYKDSDGNTESNAANVSLTVEQVDEAPVNTVPGAQTLAQNATLAFSGGAGNAISVQDSDSEGGVEQVALKVEHGTLKLGTLVGLQSSSGNETASVTAKGTIAALNGALAGLMYSSTHNYHGADTLTLETDDLGNTGLGGPLTTTSSVAITVTVEVYDHAVNDSYSANEDQVLKVAAPGLLANDTETGGFTLEVKGVTNQPAHGTVAVNPDGSFTYTPSHLFVGEDSFTYKDTDGNTESNEATVTITVEKATFDHAVNDSYAVHENATLNVSAPEGVLKNDTDSEGLTLQAGLVKATTHGALNLETDGAFKYEPAANFSGTDSFTYKDTDGNTESNEATVTITVEHLDRAPVNTVPGAQTVNSGEAIVFSVAHANAISVNDVDAEGGAELVKLSVAHGTLVPGSATGLTVTGSSSEKLTLEGAITALNKALEGLTYTANAHYGGPDKLTLETDDLGHTGVGGPKTTTSEVPITVLHVNEAPTNSVPAAQEVTENTSSAKTSLAFSKAGSNVISVNDADAGSGAELVKLSVAHGTLVPGSTTGLTVTGSSSEKLTLEGTIAALNEGLEGFTYTPTINYSGPDTLSLEINDNGHTGSGGAKTSSATVEITVKHSPPIPTNPTYSGAIGNTEFSVGVPAGGAPDVEQSGSVLPSPAQEPDGSTLTVVAETISSTHGGSVTMNENGTFTYQPPVGFENASDTFNYKENDSRGGKATGTATIKVDDARVWYVNDNLGSNGNGESNSPFNVISSVSGGASPTGSGDVIFLYGGGASYTGGIELKPSQALDGQDEGLNVEGNQLVSASGANPTITDSSGAGITIAEEDAVKGVTVSSTSATGITATNVNKFQLDSKVQISGAGGNGLEVNGGNGNVTDEASIATSAAHSLLLEKRAGGTFTASGPITDTGTGLDLNSNTGATIDITGKLSLNTTTHGAFNATGGGTVAATDGENTAVTSTATAVRVQNTTIGAGNLDFQKISASGAPTGIALENTGSSGKLTVTGTGTASSGGEIANPTNVGALLNNTSGPSLSWMHIHDAANFAVSGETVSGLALEHDVIDGINGASNTAAGASLELSQLTGTATILGSTITGGYHDDVRIEDSSGTLSPLTVEGDTISQTNSDSNGNDGMLIVASGTATVNPTISKTNFTAARNDLLFLDVTAKSSETLTMNSATPNNSHFSNSNTGIVSGGGGVVLSAGGPSAASTLKYDIENATFEGALGNAVSIGSATGTNTVIGKFLDNTVGVSGVVDSGSKQGSDLSIAGVQHGTITTAIEGNKLYQYNNHGLGLSTANEESAGAPYMTLNATVKNNTIAQPDEKNALNGVEVVAGTGETGTESSVCLNMASNTLTGSGVTSSGGFDVFLEVPAPGKDSILLQGYSGAANTAGEIETFLKGTNTVGTIGAFNNEGTIKAAPSSCPTPP